MYGSPGSCDILLNACLFLRIAVEAVLPAHASCMKYRHGSPEARSGEVSSPTQMASTELWARSLLYVVCANVNCRTRCHHTLLVAPPSYHTHYPATKALECRVRCVRLCPVVQDPRAPRSYLFSDGQNMYNRVVLVCTWTYTYPLPWADGQFSGTGYYRYLQNCTHFTYSLEDWFLRKLYGIL